MFRTKQIAMVAILGLALATATVFVTTQSVQALTVRNDGNGVAGGTPPGLGVACGTPAGNHNPNCGGTTPTGDGFGRGF